MKKYVMIIICMLFLLGINGDLFAQQGQRQGGRGGGGGKPPQGMRTVPGNENRPGMRQREAMQDLKMLERLRMMKLLDLLDLDEKTEAIVIPYIRKHNKQMFQLMKEHQKKIDQLANGLRENKFSDNQIIERIIEIDKLERERINKITEFHLRAKEILTAEQLGKLYVFQARFGGEVLEKMRDFKKAQDERRLIDSEK